jgi:hypothetical protein
MNADIHNKENSTLQNEPEKDIPTNKNLCFGVLTDYVNSLLTAAKKRNLSHQAIKPK